nr:protein MATERNALLY EXPRESSED GENE 5-like [Lolium perenne]
MEIVPNYPTIEGIPTDCERREVSHIFRPFVGFKEVRLVTKDPRHPGGDPIVLCFVDFANAAQAAVSMEALQGKIYSVHPNHLPVVIHECFWLH